MTKRQYHADGLDFVSKVFAILSENRPEDTQLGIQITNARKHITDAAAFLRREQDAINLLCERDEFDGD